MSVEKTEKVAEVTNTHLDAVTGRGIIPFTGGILMLVYAFFWPESYGAWLGTIVHAFRVAAGF